MLKLTGVDVAVGAARLADGVGEVGRHGITLEASVAGRMLGALRKHNLLGLGTVDVPSSPTHQDVVSAIRARVGRIG